MTAEGRIPCEKHSDILAIMLRIRLFETKVLELIARKELGSIHAYMGQEAIAAGVCVNLRKSDYVVSTHRALGHYLAKGGDIRLLMAELFGKVTGCSKGNGGEMHVTDMEAGFLGSFPIVGAGISVAVGAAIASRLREQDSVTICFFGEGASNNGCFHEAINIASLFRAPIVFVCENNGMTINMSSSECMSVRDVATRASSYGISGAIVDGNDPLAVYKVAHEAITNARHGNGPVLVEAKTCRLRPHKEGLADTRPPSEIARCNERDPVKTFSKKLLDSLIMTESEIANLQHQILVEIDDAVRFAKNSPYPRLEESLALNYG